MMDEFYKIKTPEELYEYMSNNIQYGFKGTNGKIYLDTNEDFNEGFPDKYELMKPEEVLEYKVGMCFEQTELERAWFINHGINHKVFFHMIALPYNNNYSTHAFLVYELNNKWYWFENSWYDEKGIHEYNTLEELLKDEFEKDAKFLRKQGITDEELTHFTRKEIDIPKFHISCIDYISYCMNEDIKS